MPQIIESYPAETLANGRTDDFYPYIDIYPEQREDDMGETSFHYKLIADLMQMLRVFFQKRDDVFLTSNMNLYYVEGNPDKWLAPDILAAFNVPNYDRRVYKLWEEKIFPQVVFEIASDRTWKKDIGEKLALYEDLGAEEYYILDCEFKYLPEPMTAFHRHGEKLLQENVGDNRILSSNLGLEIVQAEKIFRLFDPEKNEFLRTLDEAESEVERLKAEIAKLKTEK